MQPTLAGGNPSHSQRIHRIVCYTPPDGITYTAAIEMLRLKASCQASQMAKKKSAKSAPKAAQPAVPRKRKSAPITRDVGPQAKGPRLQKLRAILMLVEATAEFPDVTTFAAVELHGDVSVSSSDSTESKKYIEEDKNYADTVSFTMNSNEILNTLVNFCDVWIEHGCSKRIRFGFYSPNNYTAESNTERTKALGITWPTGPMLKSLKELDFDCTNVLDSAKRAVLSEYDSQATRHGLASTPSNCPLGRLEILQRWSDDRWKDYFRQIQWKFGEDDAEEIVPAIVTAIQRSTTFTLMTGREIVILPRQLIRHTTRSFESPGLIAKSTSNSHPAARKDLSCGVNSETVSFVTGILMNSIPCKFGISQMLPTALEICL